MNCGDFRYLIQRRFDVELSPADDRALLIHLETCESCQKFYHQVQQVIIAAEEMEISEEILPQNPERLLNAVLENIPNEKPGIKTTILSFFSRFGLFGNNAGVSKTEPMSSAPEPTMPRRLKDPLRTSAIENERNSEGPSSHPITDWGRPAQPAAFPTGFQKKGPEIVAPVSQPEEQIITRSLRDKFGGAGANNSMATNQPLTLAESIRQRISEMSKTGGDYQQSGSPAELSHTEPMDEWSVPHSPEWPKLAIDAPPEEWPNELAGSKAPQAWGKELPGWGGNEQQTGSPIVAPPINAVPSSALSEQTAISQADNLQMPNMPSSDMTAKSELAVNKQHGWSAEAEQLETGTWQTVQFDTTLSATNTSYMPPSVLLPNRAVIPNTVGQYAPEAISPQPASPAQAIEVPPVIRQVEEVAAVNNDDVQSFIPSGNNGPKIYPVVSRRVRSSTSLNELSADVPAELPAEQVAINPSVIEPAPLPQAQGFITPVESSPAPLPQAQGFITPVESSPAPLPQAQGFITPVESSPAPLPQAQGFITPVESSPAPLPQAQGFITPVESSPAPLQKAQGFASPALPEAPLEFIVSSEPKTVLPSLAPANTAKVEDEGQHLFKFDDGAIDKLFSNNLGVHERSVSASTQSSTSLPPAPVMPPPTATPEISSMPPSMQPVSQPAMQPASEPRPATIAPDMIAPATSTPAISSASSAQFSTSAAQAPVPGNIPQAAPATSSDNQGKANSLFAIDDNMIDRIFTDHLGVPEQVSKDAFKSPAVQAALPEIEANQEMTFVPNDYVTPTSLSENTTVPPVQAELRKELEQFGNSSSYVSGKQKVAGVGRLDNRVEPSSDPGSGRIASIGKFLLDSKDLEKIGRITASDLSEGKMRTLTLEANEELKTLLRQIDAQQGVLGTLVVGHDGLLIAHTMSQDADAETLGVEAFGVFMGTVQIVEKLGDENVRQIVSQTNQGYLIIANFGAGLLVTLTNPIMLDKLLPLMRTITQLVAA